MQPSALTVTNQYSPDSMQPASTLLSATEASTMSILIQDMCRPRLTPLSAVEQHLVQTTIDRLQALLHNGRQAPSAPRHPRPKAIQVVNLEEEIWPGDTQKRPYKDSTSIDKAKTAQTSGFFRDLSDLEEGIGQGAGGGLGGEASEDEQPTRTHFRKRRRIDEEVPETDDEDEEEVIPMKQNSYKYPFSKPGRKWTAEPHCTNTGRLACLGRLMRQENASHPQGCSKAAARYEIVCAIHRADINWVKSKVSGEKLKLWYENDC